MKNKFLPLLAGALVVASLSSCKKWIEYDPKEDFQITEKNYLSSESDYRTMTVSVYTPMQWLCRAPLIGDIATNDAASGGENASDVLALQQIDDFTHTSVNNILTELWQEAYEGINRANYMHQYKQANPAGKTIDFAGKDALYGEVYFLRAYYYFHLVRFFGDVPLFVDKRLSLSESRSLQRAPKADVYAQIERDLTSAIGVLPAVQVQKGRITKYAAQALLGKVYLYQNKFDSASQTLESVITSNAFSLVTNFGSQFMASGENGTESVFEIQHSNNSPYYNWAGPNRGQGNFMVQMVGVRGLNGNALMPYSSGWSFDLPTASLSNAFAAGDLRKSVTILDIEAYKNANPGFNITYQVAPYKNTGMYNQKYHPRKGETSGQIELNYKNNFRVIRYADVLLMAAEAFNRSATPNDTKAQQYLNLVRARAFGNTNNNISATGTTLRTAIWDERRLELAMEGERFFDLVRTGQAASKITGFQTNKHEVFPIPQIEIDISVLSQNNNY
jgi:hypothetical protein